MREHDAIYIRTAKERRPFIIEHPNTPVYSKANSHELQHWYDHGAKEAMLLRPARALLAHDNLLVQKALGLGRRSRAGVWLGMALNKGRGDFLDKIILSDGAAAAAQARDRGEDRDQPKRSMGAHAWLKRHANHARLHVLT